MLTQDGVAGLALIFGVVIYVLFAALDLPIITGGRHRLPALARQVHEGLLRAYPKSANSTARATAEFLIAAALTQLTPVMILLSPDFSTALRIASVIELVIAVALGAYLVRGSVPSR